MISCRFFLPGLWLMVIIRSSIASLPFGQYHIILLGDREAHVCEQLAQSCYTTASQTSDHESDVITSQHHMSRITCISEIQWKYQLCTSVQIFNRKTFCVSQIMASSTHNKMLRLTMLKSDEKIDPGNRSHPNFSNFFHGQKSSHFFKWIFYCCLVRINTWWWWW